MAKSKETAPIYMVRRGPALCPETELDAAAIEPIPQGFSVRVEIKQQRSHPRLRAYWAMLKEVVDATDCASSPEKLHEALKLGLGIVEYVRIDGFDYAIPGSIAFDKMTENEMVAYFTRAQEWLGRTYGYEPARAA